MNRRMTRALAAMAFLVASTVAYADIASQTVTLDLEKGTISPSTPTINIKAEPSVVLEIVPFKCTCNIKPTYDHGPLKESGKKGGKGPFDQEVKTAAPESNAFVFNFAPGPDRDAKYSDDSRHLWHVTLPGREDYLIEVLPDQEKGCNAAKSYYVVIHVDTAAFELNWSAGFAMTSLRDTRLRLDPITGDDKHLAIVENGHEGIPSNVVALAHYCYAKHGFGALCLSSGVGTDLPSSGVLLMFGPSLRLRPIDNANSFYLTVGGVYGPRKVLNDDYAGRTNPIVPVGTSTSSLLSTRYGMGWGISLSYGFIDAKDKFKGVFSGNGSKSSEPAKSTGQK